MSWKKQNKKTGIQYVSIRGSWRNLVWLSKHLVLDDVQMLFESKFVHSPPMNNIWIAGVQQMSTFVKKKAFKMILIFFCASPISLSYYFPVFFFFSLSCLLFVFSSFLLCIIPHVFLAVYWLYDMGCIYVCCSSSNICVLFLFFIILSCC